MAISAAHRSRTAASPGNAPTSSTNCAGRWNNPAGQQADCAVAPIFMIAREGRVQAGLGRQVRSRRIDRLDTGLFVVGNDRHCIAWLLLRCRVTAQVDLAARALAPRPRRRHILHSCPHGVKAPACRSCSSREPVSAGASASQPREGLDDDNAAAAAQHAVFVGRCFSGAGTRAAWEPARHERFVCRGCRVARSSRFGPRVPTAPRAMLAGLQLLPRRQRASLRPYFARRKHLPPSTVPQILMSRIFSLATS
jgi:hypothetical protein